MTEQEKMEELVDVLEMDLGEFDRDTEGKLISGTTE